MIQAGPGRFKRDAAIYELHAIAEWWLDNSLDETLGGFVGEVDYHGNAVDGASKGVVLNSRILWFFSELCLFDPDARYRRVADRAFQYLTDRFHDEDNGGAVWELAPDGSVIDGKKQTYAICFCIYAFVAYYRLTSHPAARAKSFDYFDIIETYARDKEFGGYLEAFSRNWQTIGDVRLGNTDMNAPKTMNTHLHLLEAYTALHSAMPTKQTEEALHNAIALFCDRIIDTGCGHLRLFFDTEWTDLSSSFSFGHDIEASWLLREAAEALGDEDRLAQVNLFVLRLADACQWQGIGSGGQLCDGYDIKSGHRSENSVWWVQAEALVGFLNAYRLTGELRYRDACYGVWQFICKHHIDHEAGEWHWMSSAGGSSDKSYYKAGFWKGPYHNGRAMMKACELFELLQES